MADASEHGKLKGFLKGVFNFAASAGAGAAVSFAIKGAVVAATGSQLAAVIPAAIGVGTLSAGIQRFKDVRVWNKDNADDKASFFDFEKTGHSAKHYLKKGALSAGFAVVGGLLGLGINHWMHGASHITTTAPSHPVAPPPVAISPPVHVPTADENLARLLADTKAHVPAQHCAGIDTAIHRMDSVHDNVRAQAVKDMGYFYANGFCGVAKDAPLADKLFEGALTISHGHNMQATHDLGYQLLNGFGAPENHARAWELLSRSAAGGDKLSPPILDYMKLHHLAP